MRTLLIGYGKMGQAIENLLVERGHPAPHIADVAQNKLLSDIDPASVDVAIDFTTPAAVMPNISHCLKSGIPLVVGTTGWHNELQQVKQQVDQHKGSLFYSSNFSLGVNLFFKLNRQLAKLMNSYPEYEAAIEEIHHLQKLDSPSGTAITTAEGVLKEHGTYLKWHLASEENAEQNSLAITALRQPDVPGTHEISYTSKIDKISLRHEAFSRQGFALGAVVAAEWLVGKNGIFTMDDLLAEKK